LIYLLSVAGVVVIIALSGLRVAQEYERAVAFRLGRYVGVRGPGLYYLVPILDRARRVDLRTVTVTVEQQETITKDSVTIKVNAVLWYLIVDPTKAILGVEDYQYAAYQVALTSLRNIIGQHMLDEVLRERTLINSKLREIVDETTEEWGLRVTMVEMKDVEIPQSMQRAMAREAEAVREKRARVIKAEAELEASQKLTEAAGMMESRPISLELRRLQMISEVGAENNSTTILMIPSDFTDLARVLASNAKTPPPAGGG
jgi:regulator of protease activity HflC (stomatin/prohibitin superfamily)